MKVINLFGGPGSGKSTNSAGIFYHLKKKGVNCELVTEYAKDLVWSERQKELSNQPLVTIKQYDRLKRLDGKVDYVVTDSPLLLGIIYNDYNFIFKSEFFSGFVWELFDCFENINFFVERKKKYNPIGRNQTEDEAKQIDILIKKMLDFTDYHVTNSQDAVEDVLKILKI